MRRIHIIAKVEKVAADTKKTQITLNLDYDSIEKASELVDITGETCGIDIFVSEDEGADYGE